MRHFKNSRRLQGSSGGTAAEGPAEIHNKSEILRRTVSIGYTNSRNRSRGRTDQIISASKGREKYSSQSRQVSEAAAVTIHTTLITPISTSHQKAPQVV